jgi:hypothetical protein
MKSELEGVWSADACYGLGAQSDEIVVLRGDGTGWIEVWNFVLCSVDFFEWTPTSPGWIVFAGTRSLELDVKTQRLVDSGSKLEVSHEPYSIQEEETPSGTRMKVLRLDLLGFGEGAFGLTSEDAESRAEPA